MKPTVSIHLKPCTANWLINQFGNPVKLPAKSNYRKVFNALLEKRFRQSREYNLKMFPQKTEFVISQDDTVYHGISLQVQLQHLFNDFFETQMKCELFMYIFAHTLKGMTIDKAVLLYQVDFGFTEETFSQDAIRQSYFRKKKEMQRIFGGTVTKTKHYVS